MVMKSELESACGGVGCEKLGPAKVLRRYLGIGEVARRLAGSPPSVATTSAPVVLKVKDFVGKDPDQQRARGGHGTLALEAL